MDPKKKQGARRCAIRSLPPSLPAALAGALLLAGCGGYFSGNWPSLAEGFSDAAERDAALAEAEGDPAHEAPEPVIAAPVIVAPRPDPAADPVPAPILAPEEIAALAARLDAASATIETERQAYRAAKAIFLEVAGDSAQAATRRHWLTAQLKLTALSRAGDPLASIISELRPAAVNCGVEDSGELCRLARRAQETDNTLVDYLASERRLLIDHDPAAPS